MNKFKFLLGIFVISAIVACEKKAPSNLDFEVATAKTEYNLADSVEFQIRGYADVISFFSGEAGKEYRYKDRTESTDGKLTLNISTQVLFAAQADNLSLMYSTDFDNLYTVDGLNKAKWNEITGRFTLSTAPAGASGSVVPSGDVDISDLPVSGKPIFFAFRYLGRPSNTAGEGGRTWRILTFNLTNKTPGGSATLATVTSASWLGIDVKNPANKWTIQTASPSLFFAPASTLLESEDWAVSKVFYPNAVNPDLGKGIKGYTDPIKNYKHKFSAPGTYTVSFIGRNANQEGVKEIVKELKVTIK